MIKKILTFIRNTVLEVKAVKYVSKKEVLSNTLQITLFLTGSVFLIVILDMLIQATRQLIIFI